MQQQLHQDHPPIQLLKEHTHHISILHSVLVQPCQPRLHQGKGQDYHQNHHHERHQNPQISQTPIYDTNDVGKKRRDFLVILLLTGRPTEIEIKTQYRKLARMYYSDKHLELVLHPKAGIVFPYYIIFVSEIREIIQLTPQILVRMIDVVEVLLCLIQCHTG